MRNGAGRNTYRSKDRKIKKFMAYWVNSKQCGVT